MSAFNCYLDRKAVDRRGTRQQHYHIGCTIRVSLDNRPRKSRKIPAASGPFCKTRSVVVVLDGNDYGMRCYAPSRRKVIINVRESEGNIPFHLGDCVFMNGESKTSLPRIFVKSDGLRDGVTTVIFIGGNINGHFHS